MGASKRANACLSLRVPRAMSRAGRPRRASERPCEPAQPASPFCTRQSAGPIIEPARQEKRDEIQPNFIAIASVPELLHLLGEHPQRTVEVHAAVDAGDWARVHPAALCRAPGLATARHVLLHPLEGRPEAVSEVFR